MVNEYLDGLEVLQKLTDDDSYSKEMSILLYQYHSTREYYNTDALVFNGFFGLDDKEMIKCLNETNINKLYIVDESTCLMHNIRILIANGFTVEGITKIKKLRYSGSELVPALTFVKNRNK